MTNRPPWKPRDIAILALIATPLPAAVVHALNFARLGQPERVRLEMVKNVAAALLLLLVGLFQVLTPQMVGLLGVALAGYFLQTQRHLFHRFTKTGERASPIWRAVVASYLAMGGLLVVATVALWLSLSDVRELEEMFDRGEYTEFRALAQEHLAVDSLDAAVRWNLVNSYTLSGEYEEAASALREYVRLHPNDPKGPTLLERIERLRAVEDSSAGPG